MSKRGMNEATVNCATSPAVRRAYLVRILFDVGVVAWNTTTQSIIHDGFTYIGRGPLGTISPIQETPGLKAASVTLTVSGVKPEIVALLLSSPYMNRKVYIHRIYLDDNYGQVAGTLPVLMFLGKLDDISGVIGASASFTVGVKSRFADWERPRKLRYTNANQQKQYPGDKGLEFIPQLAQKRLIWPLAKFQPDPRD